MQRRNIPITREDIKKALNILIDIIDTMQEVKPILEAIKKAL